jgi:hypothetical protein
MKIEQTECSETLAFKLQTPGNHPEESIRHYNRHLIFDLAFRKESIKYLETASEAETQET